MSAAAYHIDGRQVDERAFYAAACDPRRSIVVEACAGSGKTWMLVSRILRALLDGAQPQEILALTFTRKAAGEMRERLNEWLSGFSCPTEPGDERRAELTQALVERGLDGSSAAALVPALGALHARLLDAGRSVSIRSFHAWFAQLLAAAPLEMLRELGLPPQPTLVEDTSDLRDDLFARFYAVVHADAGLRASYLALIGRHRLSRVGNWLERAWRLRVEVERADAAGTLVSSVPAAAEYWPACAGLDSPTELIHHEPLAGQLAGLASALGRQVGAIPQKGARELRLALDEPDAQAAFAAACKALMTVEGGQRKKMGDLPAHTTVCAALRHIDSLHEQQRAHEDHRDMVVLARVLLAEYAALKHQRGLADMGDLETAALTLLADPVRAGWVQQRLDTTLSHVLIDEFQDTSPLQWHALHGWLSAYAGAGGGASGRRPPSVFIVGDPKQSIYRFRRAEPRVFEAARAFVVDGLAGSVLECDHTRRCASGIVSVLNEVFTPAAAAGQWPGFRAHTTGIPEGGEVLQLPSVPAPPRAVRGDAEPFWRDTLTEPRHEPEEQRRAQEGAQVAAAVDALLAAGRTPGSIMVLARRRVALRAVSEALSARQLPHVMPEPIRVGDEPEAQDLLALLDVLASPGHDLALARALRSPVFGASDTELLVLSQAANAAHGTWHAALTDPAAAWTGPLDRARRLLRAWSELMPWLPPHDLLDRIVGEADVVARVAAAVPAARRATALQVIDALLAAALDVDGGRYATPYGFVRALRSRRIEYSAVPAADAVSLLTVHGAKGLQADVVFVVDTDPGRQNAESGAILVDWPVHAEAPRWVAFVASDGAPPPSLQGLQQAERAAQQREELNGLYVAITRAKRLLVVSRTESMLPGSAVTWWQRLQPHAREWNPGDSGVSGRPQPPIQVPALPQRRPVAVAVAAAVDVTVTATATAAAHATAVDADRARLGRAVHHVLEWVTRAQRPGQPERPHDKRSLDAAAAAAARLTGLDEAGAAEVRRSAEQVLTSPGCARFFDAAALAWAGNEVPVIVDGQPGRIDRLVAFDTPGGREWWVLDYKLGPAPGDVDTNRMQIAGYVAAVQALQPGERVHAAFITGTGQLVVAGTG